MGSKYIIFGHDGDGWECLEECTEGGLSFAKMAEEAHVDEGRWMEVILVQVVE